MAKLDELLSSLEQQLEQLSFDVNTSKNEKQFERGRIAQIMIDHAAIKSVLESLENGN